MYKIVVYIPLDHVESVKNAMFQAGAGRIGNYECCSWQTQGEGQFRPLAGSKPFLGVANSLERVAEYRVEMICAATALRPVVKALRASHPYEEPAFDVMDLIGVDLAAE